MPRRLLVSLVLVFVADRGLGLALDQAARGVHDGERTGGLVRAVVDHPEARVLLLGSSRVRRHLDPRRFEAALGVPVRNAGCDGQGVAYARAVAALARAHGSRAERYVVDLNPFDLVDARESRVGVLAPFFGHAPVVDELLEARSAWAPLYLRSHAYRYNSAALPLAFRALRGARADDDRGFAPLAAGERPHGGAPRAPSEAADEAAEARGMAHYRSLLREARAADVAVTFVVGPVRDGWSEADQRRLRRLVDALADEEARVIDLRHLALARERWVDPIHLDAEGADELSRRAAAAVAGVWATRAGESPNPTELRPAGAT